MTEYDVVKVVDDRINVDTPKVLVADEGPSSATFQSVIPPDPTSLNPVFSVQLPSSASGLNRKMYWRMAGTLTVTGANLNNLTATNRVAFRQFPLQNACSSVQVQVNDSTISVGNIGQIISGLLRKGITSKSLGGALSDVNCAPDLTADYSQAIGASGIFDPPGNAPYSNYTSQSRTQGISSFVVGGGNTTMTITFDIQEPIIVPPFEYGDAASNKSIFGVNTLQISCNMGNVHRMLSMALTGSGATVTSVALAPTSQRLDVSFVTPRDRSVAMTREREYLYGFTSVQSFISTLTSGAVASGASVTGTSNVVDLPVVPKGFIVYATYSETDRANATQSLPDVCFPITSIQCSFMTRSGLLSGATQDALYQMNVKNGVSYPAWAHSGLQLVGSSSTAPFPRGAGNILYIDTAGDLSLPDGVSPGMGIKSQFSVDSATFVNPTPNALTAPRLVVIALTDGILRNKDGSSGVTLGGVPGSDDNRFANAKTVMRSELVRLSANGGYGGSFWDKLKKLGEKIRDVGKKVVPILAPIAEQLAPQYASQIEMARKVIGAGRKPRAGALMGGESMGGALLGGARRPASAASRMRHLME